MALVSGVHAEPKGGENEQRDKEGNPEASEDFIQWRLPEETVQCYISLPNERKVECRNEIIWKS